MIAVAIVAFCAVVAPATASSPVHRFQSKLSGGLQGKGCARVTDYTFVEDTPNWDTPYDVRLARPRPGTVLLDSKTGQPAMRLVKVTDRRTYVGLSVVGQGVNCDPDYEWNTGTFRFTILYRDKDDSAKYVPDSPQLMAAHRATDRVARRLQRATGGSGWGSGECQRGGSRSWDCHFTIYHRRAGTTCDGVVRFTFASPRSTRVVSTRFPHRPRCTSSGLDPPR